MTTEELYKFSMGKPHFYNHQFYWYNGEVLSGRIVICPEEIGTFDQWSYYFMPHEHYVPRNNKTLTKQHVHEHGREITNPNCIEFASMSHFYRNNEPLDHRERKQIRKLIIVGAGASFDFDSTSRHEGQFPLTDKLFKAGDELMIQAHPGLINRQNDLANVKNVEKFFQQKWGSLNKKYNPDLLSELLNIQYYLHTFFFVKSQLYRNHTLNNYRSLASKIHEYCHENEDEHIGIISYNYDTLFESALENKFNFKHEKLTDYFDSKKRPFIFFKPHGSANWVKRFTPFEKKNNAWTLLLEENGATRYEPLTDRATISFAETLAQMRNKNTQATAKLIFDHKLSAASILNITLPEIELTNIHDEPKNSSTINTNKPYFPQLLIPYQDKDDFVMPKNHTLLLDKILPEVEEILIIGWKGQEKLMLDKFKIHLHEKDIKIIWVDGLPDPKIKGRPDQITEIKTAIPNSRWLYKPIGFKGFVSELAEDNDDFFNASN